MILLTLLFGLIGLGIIVFIHESGHFIAAKSCGIEVETFSLGWGRKMVGFEYGGTTYQISWFPIGGFCKMKGEMLKGDMSEEDMEKMRHERGSFLAASPWQRAVVGVAGPLANILFAVLVLTLIWWIGFNVHSSDNRIILASDHTMDPFAGGLPAEKAGLETGDRIVGIDGEKIDNFWQISESVKRNPGRPLIFQIKRESGISKSVESLTVSIVPDPDPESGQGRIGIYAWIPPVVSKVETAKPGDLAGLKPGDLITRMNDREIRHDVDFFQVLWEKPQNVLLTFKRGQQIKTGILHLEYDKNGSLDLGLVFEHKVYRSPNLDLIQSLSRGTQRTWEILALTVRSLGQLVKLKVKKLDEVVAGPIRITKMVGEAATGGFTLGLGEGFNSYFQFLSLFSTFIALMNLLPIPALDGGLIILSLLEGVRNKPLKPRFIYRFQIVGFLIILVILATAVLSDILFFVG